MRMNSSPSPHSSMPPQDLLGYVNAALLFGSPVIAVTGLLSRGPGWVFVAGVLLLLAGGIALLRAVSHPRGIAVVVLVGVLMVTGSYFWPFNGSANELIPTKSPVSTSSGHDAAGSSSNTTTGSSDASAPSTDQNQTLAQSATLELKFMATVAANEASAAATATATHELAIPRLVEPTLVNGIARVGIDPLVRVVPGSPPLGYKLWIFVRNGEAGFERTGPMCRRTDQPDADQTVSLQAPMGRNPKVPGMRYSVSVGYVPGPQSDAWNSQYHHLVETAQADHLPPVHQEQISELGVLLFDPVTFQLVDSIAQLSPPPLPPPCL